jgi:hypothetical protein
MFWQIAVPYLLILAGIALRTALPFVRAALFYMRDNGDWPKFENKFWIPPLATFLIDLIAFGLGLLLEPEMTKGFYDVHWTALVLIGIGGQEVAREIQRWFEQKPAASG